ncbi:MAG TPA: alpha/beta hydrolase [Aggregatilineales bacterium]|nr:alpha/beta hydrolase [Aggregatilineales bacterium]
MGKGENRKLQENNDPLVVGAIGAGTILATVAAAIGGWIGYSALGINHRAKLTDALSAERRTFASTKTGVVSYYVDRTTSGRPLVLIHSINAAASAYEMRPLFEYYRSRRSVYAPDLPGFGFSDRSPRTYSPVLYVDTILDFLETQVRHGPADVVALSLSCEFAARAAFENPDLFHSLTLISPTGFGKTEGTSNGQLYNLIAFPLWSQAIYDLIVTPASLRFFLKKSFLGKVDRGLLDYAYATSHQPGARYAPLLFIGGGMFTSDIYEQAYSQLEVPTLALYDKDAFTRFDRLPQIVEQRKNWHAVRISPTSGLPHWEQRDRTIEALEPFWKSA